jgi:hypothetical protein
MILFMISGIHFTYLTSRPPLKQTVWGVFDFAKIIAARGPKN